MRRIASELGRARTTISREIARNSCNDGTYRPFKASHRTRGRRSRSRRNARITVEKWQVVDRYLRMDWSPEQVSGFLRAEGLMRISHESIYVHVWHDKARDGDLWKHLRQSNKKARKRYHAPDLVPDLSLKYMVLVGTRWYLLGRTAALPYQRVPIVTSTESPRV